MIALLLALQGFAADPSPMIEATKHGAAHGVVAIAVQETAEAFGVSPKVARLVATVGYPVAFEGVAEWARWGRPLWESRDGQLDILEAQLPWALHLVRVREWGAASGVFGAWSLVVVARAGDRADARWSFASDKRRHTAAGATLGLMGYHALGEAGAGEGSKVVGGLSLALAAGAVKEAADPRWSWEDLTYDVIGGLMGVGLGWALREISE